MKMFIPLFLLLVVFSLVLIYVPTFRVFLRTHMVKVGLTIVVVGIVLFILFAAMSVSSWRLF